MSIFGMMRTATSGMGAQSNRLGTVADNIANASTAGYKRASTEFSSLVLESGNGEYNSGSVNTSMRYAITQQGGFDFTTSATDLAVSGNGFLVVADGTGTGSASHLTRAGSFLKDGDGYLVNSAGYFLLGVPWGVDPNTQPALPANGASGLEAIQIQTQRLEAEASTLGTFNINVPLDATIETNLPSANTAMPVASYKSSLVAIDNLGQEVTLDVYLAKTATGPDTWEITVFDHRDADPTSGSFPYAGATVPLVTEPNLIFDATTGKLDVAGGSATSITIPVPNGGSLVVDMSKTTQLAAPYQVIDADVNGTAPSAVDHIEIDDTGTLFAVYENGQRVKKALIPLATVSNPNNLTPVAGNAYDVSASSGDLLVGAAGRGGLGSLVPKALEKSTVDIASELTTMIEAQHSFTANSKVFQTAADLMEVLVNLRR